MAGPVNGLAVGPSAGVTGSDRRSPPRPPEHGRAQDRCVVAASGGASQDSGSYCRPVASVNSGAQWNRSHRCLQPSTHEGGLPVRTRRVVMDDFAMLGRGRLVTDRGRCSLRTTCPVLQVVLLVGPDAAGEEGVRLQPEELRPGRADPAGRWAQASPSEHRGDGRCRDIDPELQELAPDPEVAPSGILPSQTKDQLLDRGIDGRATRPAGPVSPTDRELSVPPDERVSADQEALPPVRREESGRRGEERPISGGEPGSHPSSPEDLQLMAEHDRLQIPLPEAAPNQQAKQTAEEPIPHSQEHGPSLDCWRPAGEWRGQSADRVSLPHRYFLGADMAPSSPGIGASINPGANHPTGSPIRSHRRSLPSSPTWPARWTR
jgi:hypothetical protein